MIHFCRIPIKSTHRNVLTVIRINNPLVHGCLHRRITRAVYLCPLSSVKYHFRTRGAVICFFQQTLSPISRALARKDIR